MPVNTIHKQRNTISCKLSIDLFRENEVWISHCRALGISGYGNTQKKAKDDFEKVLQIFFEETMRNGTLEQHLLLNGWSLKLRPDPIYRPPVRPVISIKYGNMAERTSYKQNVSIPVFC